MIHFSCSRCGQKFKVKDDFAGRTTKCPACKEVLVVPQPDMTAAYIPNERIEGLQSSVARAGIEADVTLGGDGASAGPAQKSVKELLARRGKSSERYLVEGEIARGGMGAVLRAVDCDIRREVAVKYLLKQADARNKARFVEEAQITGQLEHPNIPPIHELGVDNQKRVFFAMKLVRGRSLAQILEELRKGKSPEKDWPVSRLLTVFVSICNALAYAHARGVIHRDLKPANVMVGDFGEVYVMDWGLAKVASARPAPSAIPLSGSSPGKVVTGREGEADLTQDGAILGTPAYMPPEQAMGKIDAIDARSDIYSLGAILYEMLTLQAPVDKDGGYLAILMRVIEGQIQSPEKRNPKRSIPKELSAIAMKALAKEPAQRYQSAEALRKDIERFQEGRSVSAKQDSFKEMAWKLVKRNKGFSAGAALAFLVLVCGTVFLAKALWETSRAKAASDLAQSETKKRTERAVPALVQSARLLGYNGQFKEALEQVDLAQAYDSNYFEATLLRGQLFIVQKDFAAGRAELGQYVRQRPTDTEAKRLLALCSREKPGDSAVLFEMAQVFQQQKASGLAVHLFKDVERTVKARQPLVDIYRRRIGEAWPGLGERLTLEPNGEFALKLLDCKQVATLDPLKGMLLNTLNLSGCPITDLTPLKGMPLTNLSLYQCGQVSDLAPLKGMPITTLWLTGCPVRDLTPLQGMSLTHLYLHKCDQVSDLTPLKDMRLTELALYFSGVTDLTPLERTNLQVVFLTPKNITRGMDVLRRMNSLKTIGLNGYDAKVQFPPAEFWKKYDAGEFK